MGNWVSSPDSLTLGLTFLTIALHLLFTNIADFTPFSVFFHFQTDWYFLFRNRSLCAQPGLQTFTSRPPSWNAFLNSYFSWLKTTQCSMWPLHQLISKQWLLPWRNTRSPDLVSALNFFQPVSHAIACNITPSFNMCSLAAPIPHC